MASMELTPEQQMEEGAEMMTSQPYQPKYAVGEMYLRQEALDALGLTGAIAPGTVVRFSGSAKVVSASMREEGDGETESCVCLQPTELDVNAPRDAKAMFPNSKMED